MKSLETNEKTSSGFSAGGFIPEDREKHKITGELINANIYQIKEVVVAIF